MINFESQLKDHIEQEVEKALYNIDLYDFISSSDIEDRVSKQIEQYIEDNIDSIIEDVLDDLIS